MRLHTFILGTTLLLSLAIGAFWPVVSKETTFIWYDQATITGYPSRAAPAPDLARIWSAPIDAKAAIPRYVPLTGTVYWLEYQFFHLNPRGYHIVNLALHFSAALLLWMFLARIGIGKGVGLLAASLFAVHPVNVESVAWISSMSGPLSLLLMLACALVYCRWARLDRPPAPGTVQLSRGSDPLYLLVFFLFVLAVLCSTEALLFPFVLLAFTWWKRGLTRRDIFPIIPLALVTVAVAAVAISLHPGFIKTALNFPLPSRLILVGRATFFYVGKLLLPINLSFNYPRWNPASELSPTVLLNWLYPVTVLAVVGGALFFARRVGRGLAAALLMFLIMLAPALLGLSTQRASFLADHNLYVPSVALFALISAVARRSLRSFDTNYMLRNLTGLVVGVPFLIGLTYLASNRSRLFVDDEYLWHNALVKNENSALASEHLAYSLLRKKRDWSLSTAIDLLRRSVALDPKQASAWTSLGTTLQTDHKYEEALQAFEHAKELDRNNPIIYNGLGVSYYALDKLGLAEQSYLEALHLQEDYADAWNNLGQVLRLERRDAAAIKAFGKAIQYNPHHAFAFFNMGETYVTLHKEQDAVDCFRAALYVEHDFAMAAAALAEILANPESRNRDPYEAVELAERANRLTGDKDITLLELLAQIYAEVRRYKDAIRIEQKAIVEANANKASVDTIRVMQARLDRYVLMQEALEELEGNSME